MKKSRIFLAVALVGVQVASSVLTIGVFGHTAVRALAESVTTTIDVSNGNSRGVALSPNGLFAYVTSEVDNALIKVDLSTNQVVQGIDVGNEPYGVTITPDGAFALVANFSSQSISKIRLSDNLVTTISLAGNPQNIVVDPSGVFAYVTLFYQNKVAKVNLATNSVTANLTVGAGPRGIAMTPDGLFAFTANDGSNTSSKINWRLLSSGKDSSTF
jgi:YVTN family beta-propeller protein